MIDQTIAEDAVGSGDNLNALCTIISKEIATDAVRSAAHIFRTPADVRRPSMDGTTPRYGNTYIGSTRLASPVRIYVSIYYQSKGVHRSLADQGRSTIGHFH